MDSRQFKEAVTADCAVAFLEDKYVMLAAPDVLGIWSPELILIVQEKVDFFDANSVDVKLHLKNGMCYSGISPMLLAFNMRLLLVLTAYP